MVTNRINEHMLIMLRIILKLRISIKRKANQSNRKMVWWENQKHIKVLVEIVTLQIIG
jgi:hypothetical protein